MMPRKLAAHFTYPLKVAGLACLPITALLFVRLPDMSAPSQSSSNFTTADSNFSTDPSNTTSTLTQASETYRSVSLQGPSGLAISIAGNTESSTDGKVVLLLPDQKLTLSDPSGTTLLTGAIEDEVVRIDDLTQGKKYRLAIDSEEYTLKSESGEVLGRVKLKEEKVNIYNGAGTRLLHAKVKKGSIQIRDESDNVVGSVATGGAMDTTSALLATGLLLMPTSDNIRLLTAAAVLIPRFQS